DGAQHLVLGQDLRQDLDGLSTAWEIEIKRHADAPLLGEKRRDRGIAIGPIATQTQDARGFELMADPLTRERAPLVDLAGQAPIRGQVDEHWRAGRDRFVEPSSRVRRPISYIGGRDGLNLGWRWDPQETEWNREGNDSRRTAHP